MKPGRFLVKVTEWTARSVKDGEMIVVDLNCQLLYHVEGGEWLDIRQHRQSFQGGVFLKGANGLNEDVAESLIRVLGWDGQQSTLNGKPPLTSAQIRVYQDKKKPDQYRIGDLYPADHPIQQPNGLTDKFDQLYGGTIAKLVAKIDAERKAGGDDAPPTPPAAGSDPNAPEKGGFDEVPF